MSRFLQELSKRNSDPSDRNWLYVPYDQLNDGMGPLARDEPNTWGIILIENSWKASCRPYHKQKLTFILANMRHFALEQASRGVAVKYVFTHGLYRDALEPLLEEFGQIRVMQPAEYALRADLQPLVDTGKVQIIPHEGWLTSEEQFYVSHKTPGPPWRMDAFYRHVRQQTGLLMEHGQPVGGKYSFDAENRKSWRGQPVAPEVPTFPIDAIKGEVGKLIENEFGRHPGKLDLKKLPATKADADTLWNWAKENCMPNFGPYEDAMSMQSTTLFHTRISSLLNIHRLLPAKVVSEAAEMDVLLSSKEGFIRQILGWREFMHHVHTVTRGFRTLADGSINKATTPGDGGYSRWAGKNWENESDREFPDGGVKPCELGGDLALPSAFWGKRSGLACLDRVVKDVWEEGYSHHITRLMVLANIATLLDVSPRELTDWFWAAYTDAYDWVVEPNVLGMGTFAVGDVLSTKPYVSGAAYINKMSDFCEECKFDPRTNCPITNLFWAFLARHQKSLQKNSRLRMIYATLRKRSDSKRRHDTDVFRVMRETLNAGDVLTPDKLPLMKEGES